MLTGSVRRSPAVIRVSAQLVDGDSGVERWSQSYDRPLGDTLSIQSGIADSVARELSLALGLAEKAAITAGGTLNAAAHDLYLKGLALLLSTGDETSMRAALSLLDGAVALDPAYAEAHARRADALSWLGSFYPRGAAEARDVFAQAEAAAKRAVMLAPSLAICHAALAGVHGSQLKMKAALEDYQRADSLGDASSWVGEYAILLAKLRRDEAALATMKRARSLDPLDTATLFNEAYLLFIVRRYPQAIAAAQKTLTTAPKLIYAHYVIGASLFLLARPRAALAEISKMPADNVHTLTMTAIVAAQAGDRAGSDRALATMQQRFSDAAGLQYAEVHAQRGELDLGLAALEKAMLTGDPGMSDLLVDVFLDPLRSDARFKTLVTRIGFP